MKSIYLPSFTFGEDCFKKFKEEIKKYGNRVAIIYGEKAWNSSQTRISLYLEKYCLRIVIKIMYGKDSSYENADKIIKKLGKENFDSIISVGGGKCIDISKVVAEKLNKPVFTIPTIASNCAAITKISVMYNPDGSFNRIHTLKKIPEHSFIEPNIIINSPIKYFWAGMGDAIAKHIESEWSMLGGEKLNYSTEMGINAGKLCYFPIIKNGKKAYQDMSDKILSEELIKTYLNVIISPGIVSLTVDPEYNGGIAHALFYGFTSRKKIEQNHLHGEIVAYGTLINLLVDSNFNKFNEVFQFNKEMGLPLKLKDLGVEDGDNLDDVIKVALENQELKHTPYKVDREKIYNAIQKLENISK